MNTQFWRPAGQGKAEAKPYMGDMQGKRVPTAELEGEAERQRMLAEQAERERARRQAASELARASEAAIDTDVILLACRIARREDLIRVYCALGHHDLREELIGRWFAGTMRDSAVIALRRALDEICRAPGFYTEEERRLGVMAARPAGQAATTFQLSDLKPQSTADWAHYGVGAAVGGAAFYGVCRLMKMKKRSKK